MSTETYSATAVSDDMIERFSRVPQPTVRHAQERFGIIAGLRPIWAGAAVTGRAYTVYSIGRQPLHSQGSRRRPPRRRHRGQRLR